MRTLYHRRTNHQDPIRSIIDPHGRFTHLAQQDNTKRLEEVRLGKLFSLDEELYSQFFFKDNPAGITSCSPHLLDAWSHHTKTIEKSKYCNHPFGRLSIGRRYDRRTGSTEIADGRAKHLRHPSQPLDILEIILEMIQIEMLLLLIYGAWERE